MKGDLFPVIGNQSSVYAADNCSKIIFHLTIQGKTKESCEIFTNLKKDGKLKFKNKDDKICMDSCGEYLFVAADSVILKFNTRTKNVIFKHLPNCRVDGTTTITSMCVIDEDTVVYCKMPGSLLNKYSESERKGRQQIKFNIQAELITYSNNKLYVYEAGENQIDVFNYETMQPLPSIPCRGDSPRVLETSSQGNLIVAFVNYIMKYDRSGKPLKRFLPDDIEEIIGLSLSSLYLWVSQPGELSCFKLASD